MTGARALARVALHLAVRRDDRRVVDALLVIFDADAARGAGVGLQHAGHLAQGLAHSAGAALVPESFDLPCRMAVSPADIGAPRPHPLAPTRQRQRRPVDMVAKNRKGVGWGKDVAIRVSLGGR